MTDITEHAVRTGDHTIFYRAAGPVDGPLVVFVHGWPELSLSWRHQLPCLASLGFRAVAPDMRGYGRSTNYTRHEDYGQEHVVGDMLGLLAALGRERAVWVGHDWGSPTVWNLASIHPDKCIAVANLCVPYFGTGLGMKALLPLIDREVYPEDEYPVGQWDYQLFYPENFEKAIAPFDANPFNLVKALFRKGDPSGKGKPSMTASVRRHGGWFGGAPEAPDIPMDRDVVTAADLHIYTEGLTRNGFFGPCSYYMNAEANEKFAAKAKNDGRLDLPVLFLGAEYDFVCETATSRLAEPMRDQCTNLTENLIKSGHWMAQERPLDVNAALVNWLATKVPEAWPKV